MDKGVLVCVRSYVCARVRVCARTCVRAYVCVCVCVCLYVFFSISLCHSLSLSPSVSLPLSFSNFSLLFHAPSYVPLLIYAQVLLDYLCTECNQPSRFYIKVDLNGGQVCRLNLCFREIVLDICLYAPDNSDRIFVQSTAVSDTRCLCSDCLAAVPRDKKLALPHTSLRHGTLVRAES